MMIGPQDRDRIRAVLERVLADEGLPERRAPDTSAGADWLESLLEPLFGLWVDVLPTVLGVVLLLFIVRFLARRLDWFGAFGRRSRRVAATGGGPSRSARATEWRERARAARAAGDLAAALRAEVLALLVALGERGDLDYRSSWTLRECVHKGRPPAELALALGEWIERVEPLSFGGRPFGEDELARVVALADDLHRAADRGAHPRSER